MPPICSGPRNARVVFVGEAPAKNEELAGKPFIGGAGELFDRALDNASRALLRDGLPGLSRASAFLTNVCHRRPADNKFEWFYKKENQLHFVAGVMRLAKDLAEIRPNVVVALGEHAMRALTDKFGISKWRGSVLPCSLVPGLKVIPTFNPAAALRIYEYKAIMEFDFQRVGAEAHDPAIHWPERTIHLPGQQLTRRAGLTWLVEPDSLDRATIAHEMLAASSLGTDIETWQQSDGSWRIACIAFSDRPERALVLDWSDASQRAIAAGLLASPVPKDFQYGFFDVATLEAAGYEVRNFDHDTMFGHHSLYPESAGGSDEATTLAGKKRSSPLQKGLAFQTSIYTAEPFYKDDGKLWKQTGDLTTFWRYNGLDAAVTREIKPKQLAIARSRNASHVIEHEMSLVEPLMTMTATGIKIDLIIRAALRAKWEAEARDLESIIIGHAGGPVNVKSPKQMTDLLYNRLKLPAKYNRKSGNLTSDKFAITELAERYKHPILMAMLKQREVRDRLERYIYAGVDSDGRMRCSINPAGTRTWRLATSRSVYGSGTNLTTIPQRRPEGRSIRRMFVADEGQVLVYSDYSQAEAREVAQYARCQPLIDLFNDPTRDVHAENAHRIFKIPLAQIGKDSLQRFLAKQGVHAGNYGQGPADLMRRINAETEITGISVTLAQCTAIQDAVNAIYPEIRSVFWQETATELRRTRTLYAPWEFPRVFYGRWDDKLLREAYAFKPQAGVGILCCKALVEVFRRVQRAMPELGVRLLLNVHDALLLSCNRGAVAQVVELVKQCMAIPVPINGSDVHIPVDIAVGFNWDKASSDNPNGLRDISKWDDHKEIL